MDFLRSHHLLLGKVKLFMHLVLLHGYLLQGTGSNIYVANIAKAWKNQGYAVTVVCQDRQANLLPFVNEYIGPEDNLPPFPPKPGFIRVVVPNIHNLLPVYVFDRYEGYKVKTIPEMTKSEIMNHIEMTAISLRSVALQEADMVLANHAIFGPVIAKMALENLDVPYNVKIHGSAVEYTLVPNPNLMEYAFEGLAGAKNIFVGTNYVKNRMLEVFADENNKLGLKNKLKIVPSGMDPDIFKLSDDHETNQRRFLDGIKKEIQKNNNGRNQNCTPTHMDTTDVDLHETLIKLGETYDQRATDADLLKKWPLLKEDEPIIIYFGKFLGVKGVGEILVTVPAILSSIPKARFIFVGFGSYREHLEGMIKALGSGNQDAFTAYARAGDFVQKIDFSKWFRRLSQEEISRITVTGMLEHNTLCELLPLASLSIVPSKWPEAFGMVAVEAMASGVLPLCNYHAGLRDVVDEVEAVSPEIAEIMKMDLNKFIDQLPGKVQGALSYLYPDGFENKISFRKIGKQLHGIAVEKFSWDGIAKRLLQRY